MATSDIRAGRAFVEMAVNDSKLVKGLNAASAKLKAFGSAVKAIGIGLTAIGGAIVTPILLSAKQFAETGDALDKMSKRTGISVEKLSELSFVAEKSGLSVEDLETSIKRMQRSIVDAGELGGNLANVFAGLGLNLAELRALSPDQQFEAIAKQLAQVSDPTLRAADAMKIFGRSGTGILPLLDNMAKATARARELGAVMSKEDVSAAVVLMNAYRDLKAALSGIENAIGTAVAPALTGLINVISQNIAAVSMWIRKNQNLVVMALATGAAIFAVGAAFIATGYTIIALGTAFGAVSAVMTSGAALIGVAWTAMTAVVTGGILTMSSVVGVFMGIFEILATTVVSSSAILATGSAVFGAATTAACGIASLATAAASTAFSAFAVIGTTAMEAVSAAMIISGNIIESEFSLITAAASAAGVAMAAMEIISAIFESETIVPILAIAAAVGVVVVAVSFFVKALREMWASAVTVFNEIASIAGLAMDGIKDAIAAANIQLAFKIAMAGVKVAWLTGLHELWILWQNFKGKLLLDFNALASKIGLGSKNYSVNINYKDDDLDRAKQEFDDLRQQAKDESDDWSWLPKDDDKPKMPDGIGEAIKAHSAGLFNVGNAGTAFELGAASGPMEKIATNTQQALELLKKVVRNTDGHSGVNLV